MKARPCLKCSVNHQGKYSVCASCIEGINTEWKQQAQQNLRMLALEAIHYRNTGKGVQFLNASIDKALLTQEAR